MSDFLIYTCPHCQKEVTVDAGFNRPNLVCSSCWEQFDPATAILKREESKLKVPFFKSSRRKLLEQKLEDLAADGELSPEDELELESMVAQLSLSPTDLADIKYRIGEAASKAVVNRIESTFHLTDEDIDEMDAIARKYGFPPVRWVADSKLDIARKIWLMEVLGEMIPPLQDNGGLMLDQNEFVYFSVPSTWSQTRVTREGYSGVSMSVPTGVKGVRFRLGQLTPIKREQLTPLSTGTLHVTSKRLIFRGNAANTAVGYKRLIGLSLFSDAIAVEESTGKPDYFSMHPMHGRFVSVLVERLRCVK